MKNIKKAIRELDKTIGPGLVVCSSKNHYPETLSALNQIADKVLNYRPKDRQPKPPKLKRKKPSKRPSV